MDHYIEIKVLPDPEFKQTTLLSALFSKLHRHIGLIAQGEIAVSFPEHRKTLGGMLRVHSSAENLTKLQELNWLKGLRDFTECSDVNLVPEACSYRTVKRVQAKSVHNKRKRSVSKGWLTQEEAENRITSDQQKELKQPYIQLTSKSNGNHMRIYIEHGLIQENATPGEFSSYGLSAVATIPWF